MAYLTAVRATLAGLSVLVGAGLVFVAVQASTGNGPVAASAFGGPFSLVDDDGRRVSEADFRGKPTVMFFGFTFCPEVCPTTLAELTADLAGLGPAADDLNVVFVSVDPERDTPEVLRGYLASFDPRIRGLMGTADEVAATAKAYAVFHRKVPLEGGDYTMDHTSSTFLMDAEGRFVGTISYGEDPKVAFAELKRLAGGATS